MAMVIDDYFENERSLVAFMNNRMSAFGKTLESVSEVINDVVKEKTEE